MTTVLRFITIISYLTAALGLTKIILGLIGHLYHFSKRNKSRRLLMELQLAVRGIPASAITYWPGIKRGLIYLVLSLCWILAMNT